MIPRFIQIHFLTSYPATLLNRDDAGFAKRLPLGGVSRIRISSQCLKRHWRTYAGEHSLSELGLPTSVRSRLTFDRYIVKPLLEEGYNTALVRGVTEAMMAEVLGKSLKAKKKEKEELDESLKTGQVTVLGSPEINFLREQVKAICAQNPQESKVAAAVKEYFGKEGKKNLKALRQGSGLGAALFGRMVTSDVLARVDSAVHVAHAFTVHAEASETDYFSAIDDLQQGEDGELGSGHINSTELTSGLFYGYVTVDLPLLISNLEGCPRSDYDKVDRTIAAQILQRFIHLVATVSPGAKLGSTAPYAHAHFVLIETGNAQPRTLANAFLNPVSQGGNIVDNTYRALVQHLDDMDVMYGKKTARCYAALGGSDILEKLLGQRQPLDDITRWIAHQIMEGWQE